MNRISINEKQHRPYFEIHYVLALPDWDPREVTPFQGFAPGLLDFIPFFKFLPALPADIIDPIFEQSDRLARRRSGSGGWIWSPVNLSTLLGKRKPTPSQPYMIVLTADGSTARAVTEWRSNLRLRPIHLSFHKGGGAIHPSKFTQDLLRGHLRTLAIKASELDKTLDISQHLAAIDRWKGRQARPSSLNLHSHNVTAPNEMVLIGAGEESPKNEEGHINNFANAEYVRGISESAQAVINLWEETEFRPAYFSNPPHPDMFLYAPSNYRGVIKRLERDIEAFPIKQAMRILDRQRGYTMEFKLNLDSDDAIKKHMNTVGPILGIRGAELKLTTLALGLRTAGSVAATVRLPPLVNRTAGVVGQLSSFLRKHENPPPIKSARVFKAVQDALLEAIPAEHIELIKQSKDGIKIIADAPLEWLPINGLPLGIKYDVSRINPVPGNLFMQQIRPQVPVRLSPDSFRDFLVLSMFEDGDHLAPYLRSGILSTMDGQGKNVLGKFKAPRSPEQFADAIAAFNGPMLIVDTHAAHYEGDVPGGLMINGKPFDVWSLAGKIRMPPIVILSACDTHPFDRSHATVANGFLACGAMAVVGTALPIKANKAARFIMRLINRAVHFGDILNQMGRAVSWSNIVGGVIRMDFATDIVWEFAGKGYYDEIKRFELQFATNNDLNPLNPQWFELLKERVFSNCNVDRVIWEQQLADTIATSDSIRYLHLGNPEAITIGDHRTFDRAREVADGLKKMAH